MDPTTSPPTQTKPTASIWLPVIEPAVKDDSCAVDYELLQARIDVFSALSFSLIAGSWLAFGVNSLTLQHLCVVSPVISSVAWPVEAYENVLIALSSLGVYLLACKTGINTPPLDAFLLLGVPGLCLIDWGVAQVTADEGAVNQYLTMQHPTKKAIFRITRELSAAKLLVDKGGDLNKLNEEGRPLLWPIYDLDVFKLFVDHGINLKGKDKNGLLFFQLIVNNTNLDFLEYVLARKKVTAADFTPTDQVMMWLVLDNFKAGPMLARHGFDVNVRDDEGFTPLQRIAQIGHRGGHGNLDPVAHAQALLESGADPSLTVAYQGSQKTALQIAQNPRFPHSGHLQIQQVLMRNN